MAGADTKFTSQTARILVSDEFSSSCHYFLLRPQLPSQLHSVTALGWYQFILLGEQRHRCVNDLSRSRHDTVAADRTGKFYISNKMPYLLRHHATPSIALNDVTC